MAKDSPKKKSKTTKGTAEEKSLDGILHELTPEECRRSSLAELNELDIKSTEDVTPFLGTLGHPKARQTIERALGIDHQNYNIWVSGMSAGQEKTVKELILKSEMSKEPEPKDYVWAWNLDELGKAVETLTFGQGEGKLFVDDIDTMLKSLKTDIPGILTDLQYLQLQQQYTTSMLTLQDQYIGMFKAKGIEMTTQGPMPVLAESPEGQKLVAKLKEGVAEGETPANDQQLIDDHVTEQAESINALQLQLASDFDALDAQFIPQKKTLFKRVAELKIQAAFGEIIKKYEGLDTVLYFSKAQKHILENIDVFLPESEFGDQTQQAVMSLGGLSLGMGAPQGPDPVDEVLSALKTKVAVDHSTTTTGVPLIIVEDDPTYENVFGKQAVPYGMGLGGGGRDIGIDDLKAGSLAKAAAAGPCYYVFHFERAIQQPGVWEVLKRAIETRKVAVKNPPAGMYLMDVDELEMDEFDLKDVKFVMLGSEAYDAYLRTGQFALDSAWLKRNFKGIATFQHTADGDDVPLQDLVGFISTVCQNNDLMAADAEAIDLALGTLRRSAGDQEEIALTFGTEGLTSVLIEADLEARLEKASKISGKHVQSALDKRRFEQGIFEDMYRKYIKKGLKHVDLEAEVVGHASGLAVLQAYDLPFGIPSVVAASLSMGPPVGGVNILGNVKMGLETYNLGFGQMMAYLKSEFAQEFSIPFSLDLLLEESYGKLDGNSASGVSTVTALSALSDTPILQRRAMTGAQMLDGSIRAIGGENWKIEGHFWTCMEMGLLDKYDDCGVVIPACNAQGLQLHPTVIEYVEQGKFHIYPVDHVKQAAHWLTGADKDGAKQVGDIHTPGTIFGDAMETVNAFYQKAKKKTKPEETAPQDMPECSSDCGGCK